MCAPTGIPILLTRATLFKWRICKTDVKATFFQTIPAQPSVYVRPLYESTDKKRFLFAITGNCIRFG